MTTPRTPARRRARPLLVLPAIAAALALVVGSAPAGPPAALAGPVPDPAQALAAPAEEGWGVLAEPPVLEETPPKDPAVDSRVADVAAAERAGGPAVALERAKRLGLTVEKGRIRLVVEASGLAAAKRGVLAAGVEIEASAGKLLQVLAAPGQLARLGRAAGVDYVRPPLPWVEEGVPGEGVAAANASAWHAAGMTGAGVKVAIVDGGFKGLAAAQAAGDLPASVTTADYCSGGFATATEHGTAVAEIVHEMAPSAQLYLVCIGTEVQLAQAVAWAQGQGVSVINHSVSWFNTARGDGSGGLGTPDHTAAGARAAGILWVNAAGNRGQTHWSGSFVDDGSGWHLFAQGNVGNGFYLAGGATACAFLKWDDWPGSAQDYDLYIADAGGSIVDYSENPQSGSQPPAEGVCYTNPGGAAVFYAAISRYDATVAPRFDLFVTGVGDIQYPVGAGSVTEPASSPATFAAGAVCWAATTIEPFSSRGPTIDGRVKPDLSGHDQVSGTTYGPYAGCANFAGFLGTSAAAPHVAGAAALVRAANPAYTVPDVETYLKGAAVDLGAGGADSTYGAGLLHLPDPAAPPPPVGVTLASSPNPSVVGATVTLTATVTPATATGALRFRDVTGGGSTELGSAALSAGTASITTTFAIAGPRQLVADYAGDGSHPPASSAPLAHAVLSPDTSVSATGVGVSYATFYPYKDGYRDTVAIRGAPGEPVSVSIKVYNGSGKVVRSWSLATRSTAWSVAWNGRNAAGTRLAAGKYKVVQKLIDARGNTKSWTAYTTISNKRLYWYTHTVTRYGAQADMKGDPGSGWVSPATSSYYRGVRLSSGTSWVAVRYPFTLRSAVVYKPLSFKVLGRSTNGTTASIGLWRPPWGSSTVAQSYDTRAAGPAYAWYTFKGDASTHRAGRTTYGLVYVEYDGRTHVFDISKVRLTYRYAVLK